MAYDDEYGDDGAYSQTNYGLAQNPLMPLGDPMAYARMMANPTGDRPIGGNYGMPVESGAPAITTQGMKPPQIMQPTPLNVPPIAHRGGGEAPSNDLQPPPPQQDISQNQLGSLSQLLQMKGLTDLAAPGGGGTVGGTTYTPGGAVATPGAGAGPGRGPTGPVPSAGEHQAMIDSTADKYGLDRKMFAAQLYQESRFNPNAVSPAGAKGFAQFMPGTAKQYGVNVNDVNSSIDGAGRYMADLKKMFGGNDQLALAAYNTGPGNVQKWLQGRGKLVRETTDYVSAITGRPLGAGTSSARSSPVSGGSGPSGTNLGTLPTDVGTGAPGSAPADIFMRKGGPTSQADQPFKPYKIAGAMQPPPASAAPGFGMTPKAGQMSPHGGPYISQGGQIFATDENGEVVGPAVKGITTPELSASSTENKPKGGEKTKVPGSEKTLPVTGGAGNDQGTPNLGGGVTRPAINPDSVVPGATTAPADETPSPDAPTQDQGQGQMVAPGQRGFMNDDAMRKLWQFMLIKSLFPPVQFRNVGYDPWAVHRYGQSGGY
jgi:hypothetical protein